MKRILIATIVFASLVSGCASRGAGSSLQITDPQQPTEVAAGKEFTIVIESNPSTGYHWDIVGDLEQGKVELVKQEYTSTSQAGMAGGGGVDVWTFKAVGAGETEITLGHYPPSNDPVEPARTVTFTVIVK